MTSGDNTYKVQSVGRAIDILEAVGAADNPLTITQIADRVGGSKSAVFSTVQTLISGGMILSSGAGLERRYQLGLRLAYLGDIALERFSFGELARPILEQITEQTGYTSRAATWGGNCAIVVSRVDGRGSVRFDMHMGQRELLHSSSVGKAMLSTFTDEEVREIMRGLPMTKKTENTIVDPELLIENIRHARLVGYAVDDEEDAEGVICIGAPVLSRKGVGVGALSITRIKSDISAPTVHRIGTLAAEYARALSQQLSG